MKCLVVGGAGFIGSKVSNILAESGRTVIALGRTSTPLHRLSKKVKYISGDYKDRYLLCELLKDTDELIDLTYATVPKTSFDDPVNDILSNLPVGVGLIKEASLAKLTHRGERFMELRNHSQSVKNILQTQSHHTVLQN